MNTRVSICIATLVAATFFLGGCGAAVFPQSGNSGSGSGTNPVILTIHDSAPTGIAVPSFEVSITGAVLEPGGVSVLTNGQTVELTQLQTNSVFLNAATSVPAGTYSSLQITYANPQFTIVNESGAAETTPSGQCAAGATCVISNPTATKLTNTVNFATPLVISATTPTLLEFDVNLNDVIQSDLSLDFSQSGGVTVNQPSGSSVSTIDTIYLAGSVASVDSSSNQFQLTASTGQTFNITTNSNTAFEYSREGQGQGQGCMANNFSCIAPGQILDVAVDIQTNGTFDAGEVDFDDTNNTIQVSGSIVAESGNPPTSFQMVVHYKIPPDPNFAPGTPFTVTISSSLSDPASYVINNGSFVVPSGVTFGSASDLTVGQEVEARIPPGALVMVFPSGAFTTDRLALEQTQLQAVVADVQAQAQPYPYFDVTQLPVLLSQQQSLQILDTTSIQNTPVQYQNLSPTSILSLQAPEPITVGGFLFNTAPPSVVATIVRAPQIP